MAKETNVAGNTTSNPINGVASTRRTTGRAVTETPIRGYDHGWDNLYQARSARTKVVDWLEQNNSYVSSQEREALGSMRFSSLRDYNENGAYRSLSNDNQQSVEVALFDLEERGKIKLK